jgi:hypothetical protein
VQSKSQEVGLEVKKYLLSTGVVFKLVLDDKES